MNVPRTQCKAAAVAKYGFRDRGVFYSSGRYAGYLAQWLAPARVQITLLCLLAAGIRVIAADVGGIVVDSESGAGIAAATVRLTIAGELVAEAFTGEDGTFMFEGVVRGRYHAIAEKDGYGDVLSSAGTARGVVFDSGGPPIRLNLTRTGAMSGLVYGSLGQPLPGRKVIAVARRVSGGTVSLIQQGAAAVTDDRGAYRLYGMPPGRYTVAVIPEGEQIGSASFSPVYYPGASDGSQAEFFALKPGEQRQHLDLPLTALAAGSRVTGNVTGIPAKWERPSIVVSLFADSGWLIQTVVADAEGRYSLHDVPPGAYRLVAWGPIFGWGGDEGPLASPRGRQGSRQITLGPSELTGVEIELRELATVEARVEPEGSIGKTHGCSAAELFLRPVDPMPHASTLQSKIIAGTATIPDVPAGRFRLGLRGLEEGCYLGAVQQGGRKLHDFMIEVNEDTRLGLTLSSGTGTVTGTVVGAEDKPAPAGTAVILVAESDSVPDEDARTASTAADGSFRIERIPPGSYRILAVGSVVSQDYLDPAFWNEHAGTHASVEQESTVEVQLRIDK